MVDLASPGLVIEDGVVTNVNATLSAGTFNVGGILIGNPTAGSSLSLTYQAATTMTSTSPATPARFAISGSTSFTFSKQQVDISLPSPELVIQGGALFSLNASLTTGNSRSPGSRSAITPPARNCP